jgi:hypothetical protein
MQIADLPAKLRRAEVTDTGCWSWTGSLFPRDGRPRFSEGSGRWVCAYRRVYTELVGPIPAGMTLDHLCENKTCINPAHLEPVTLRVNLQRYHAANARRGIFDPFHRAKLTDDQVREIRSSAEAEPDLANRHGVTRRHIHAIRTGLRRENVAEVAA